MKLLMRSKKKFILYLIFVQGRFTFDITFKGPVNIFLYLIIRFGPLNSRKCLGMKLMLNLVEIGGRPQLRKKCQVTDGFQ